MAKVELIIVNQTGKRRRHTILLIGIVAALFAAAIICLICKIYTVKGPDMEPSLYAGDKLFDCRFQQLQYGDLVLFRPIESNRPTVKRVIGFSNDTIVLCQDGSVTRNGSELEESYAALQSGVGCESLEITVGENELFVLCDNRADFSIDQAMESGQIPISSVYGVIVRIFH